MKNKQTNWDATKFFSRLTRHNRLTIAKGFEFANVSGLEGFEDALQKMQGTKNFVCVSDTAQGYTELNETPHTRRVKTVFLAMRYQIQNMGARQECMDTMREVFRQFMSVLIQERIRISEGNIYLEPRITFHEIEQYFFSGCACCYFQVAVDVFTNLSYDAEEWTL